MRSTVRITILTIIPKMIEFLLPYHPAKCGSNVPERSILHSALLLVGFHNAIGATYAAFLYRKLYFKRVRSRDCDLEGEN